MKLEQQVVSLELAQKLKNLGVRQESIFYYAHQGKIWSREHYYDNYNSNDENDQEAVTFEYYLQEVNGGEIYSAYTVAELGEMLPDYITCFRTAGKSWVCQPLEDSMTDKKLGTLSDMMWADTEADTRAKMLIYLLENNLISSHKGE